MSYKAGILNAYDWRNRGDRAIIEAQMAWIRTKVPDVEFRVFSACWKENIHAFGADRSFPPPVSIPEGAGRLGGILGPLRSYAASSAGKGDGRAWDEFSTCDGYFLCGGGYLYSSHAPLLSRQLWIHAANSLLALKSGKPVMQFPQSWGPFRKASDEWICRKLGEALPKIAARGDISAAITGKMGFSDKTLNLPDVVIVMLPSISGFLSSFLLSIMPTTLRIVHVGFYDPHALNGVSATIVGQCEGLAAHGANLEIWTFHPGITQVTVSKTESGIPIFSLPRYGNLFLAALKAPRRTREWIRARLPEIHLLHLHSVFSPP